MKKKTSVTLDDELVKWMDTLIDSKRFANRSHIVEYSLQTMRENRKE